MKDASEQLRVFAARAFRREVRRQDIAQYLDWLEVELGRGVEPVQALLSCYRAILCSSRFFLIEPSDDLDRAAVASRLSYFLWE